MAIFTILGYQIVLSTTELGQFILAVILLVVGFILNRKSNQIHVLVNSRLEDALTRIKHLEEKLGLSKGEPIPAEAFVKVPVGATIEVP